MTQDKWTVDTTSLIARRDNLRTYTGRLYKQFSQASGALRTNLLDALATEPGSPTYPLRWKNQRQKRKVMMLLRQQNNLPYQRTHELVKQWTTTMVRNPDGGKLLVTNLSPISAYVQGDWQQPFHADTKWPQIDKVGKTYSQRALKLFDSINAELLEAL